VFSLLLMAACSSAIAEENLLGLPAPRDVRSPGAVVLHGGGRITEDAFDRFVELAGGRQARIVLVPCAGYRVTDYESESAFLAAMRWRYSSWVALATSGRIRSFRFMYTDQPDDAEAAAFVQQLESATGVWFSGGSQARLNYRFVGSFPAQTKFQAALRDVIARGGVVGGTSAGMAALPEIMTFDQDREHADAPATIVAAHGLGVFNKAIVEQHFDARGGRLERFTGLLRDSQKLDALAGRRGAGIQMLGLAVEEGGALVVQNDRLQVMGTANSHVFLKTKGGRTITWHEFAPGETVKLKRDVAGGANLYREEVLVSQ